MFALEWFSGFAFWSIYLLCGAVFCIIFTKFKAKDTYAYITGQLERRPNGNDYKSVTYSTKDVQMDEVTVIIIIMFLLWPFPFIITTAWLSIVVFFKGSAKLSVLFLRAVAKVMPEVSINKTDK